MKPQINKVKTQQHSLLDGGLIATDTNLKDRFVVPPFSVLDTRAGDWQNRKRRWKALGMQSELGRGQGSDGLINIPAYSGKAANGREHGTTFGVGGQNALNKIMGERRANPTEGEELNPVSIFDPVICELMYYWFCPPGGRILDPFAGGSVRGIVANHMGFDYTGIDLRPEQVESNYDQGIVITPDNVPNWVCGDSNEVLDTLDADYDFVFSCPPYHDLEIYSDDPKDLSTMSYMEFISVYLSIIKKAVAKLKPNRFACFVVGDMRDEEGYYRGFVEHTRECFNVAGAKSYNDIVILNVAGSAPIRAGKLMNASRKLVKTHQNILVFYKGDPKQIKTIFPEL